MDLSSVPQCVTLFILLILSAFFSSAETALKGVSEIRIRTLAEEGRKSAKRVLKLLNNQDKMLSAILIGNNIVNLSASALTTTLAIRFFSNTYIGVATGILTFLILVFGEITPKVIATKKSEKMALLYSGVICALVAVMTPLIFIVNGCSKLILKLFRFKEDSEPTITGDDIQTVLDVSHEEGVLEKEEHEMLTNLVSFGDTKVKDVMVPKVHINFVNYNITYDELMDFFKENKNTRYPVYKETSDEVVGIINMKDLLLMETEKENFSIEEILRKPSFTYETKNTLELLAEMKKDALGIIIVLDEYGVTSGLVTMEDLLEEIVGEIHDEYDEEEVEAIRKISNKTYIIEGSTPIVDCNEELNLNLESQDYDSLGGYIIENLDSMPCVGDTVVTPKGDKLTIKKLDGNRIEKVYVILKNEKLQR